MHKNNVKRKIVDITKKEKNQIGSTQTILTFKEKKNLASLKNAEKKNCKIVKSDKNT